VAVVASSFAEEMQRVCFSNFQSNRWIDHIPISTYNTPAREEFNKKTNRSELEIVVPCREMKELHDNTSFCMNVLSSKHKDLDSEGICF
jgi:hypothetical protein